MTSQLGSMPPTEAAAITVGFCLVAGLLVPREIKWKALPDILLRWTPGGGS